MIYYIKKILSGAKLIALVIGAFTFGAQSLGVYAVDIKFMSYNVHQRAWSEVFRGRVVEVIRQQNPDVLALQEVSYKNKPGFDIDVADVRPDLEADLSDQYDFYGRESFDPILVRKAAGLRYIDDGFLVLQACRFPRQVNWVQLEEIKSGKSFIIYNTHLCPRPAPFPETELTGEQRNQLHANQIAELMAGNSEPETLRIFTGDLNASATSATIAYLIDGTALPVNGAVNPLKLSDTWRLAGNTGDKPATNNPDLPEAGDPNIQRPTPPPPMSIDWIITEPSAKISAAEVIRNSLTITASDHFPVSAVFTFL